MILLVTVAGECDNFRSGQNVTYYIQHKFGESQKTSINNEIINQVSFYI